MGSGVDWAVQDVTQLRQWLVDGLKPRKMRALRPDWSLGRIMTKIIIIFISIFAIVPLFSMCFSYFMPCRTRFLKRFFAVFMQFFMSCEPPVDPETVPNLRG